MANTPKSKKKISNELLDELLGGEDPQEAFLNGGLLDGLKKRAITERVYTAYMLATHLT